MTSITYLYIFATILIITSIFWTGLSCYRIFVNEGGNTISKAVWRQLSLGLAFILLISILLFSGINVLTVQKHYTEQLDTLLAEFASQSELHYDTTENLRICAKEDLSRLLSGGGFYKAIECLKLNQFSLSFANADAQNTLQNELVRELRSPNGMNVVAKIKMLDEMLNNLLILNLIFLVPILLIGPKLLIDGWESFNLTR